MDQALWFIFIFCTFVLCLGGHMHCRSCGHSNRRCKGRCRKSRISQNTHDELKTLLSEVDEQREQISRIQSEIKRLEYEKSSKIQDFL